MSVAVNLLTATYTVVAGILAFVAFRALTYSRSQRVAWIGMGFVLLFVKGILLSAGLFMRPSWEDLLLPALAIDTGVLASFYVAVLRR